MWRIARIVAAGFVCTCSLIGAAQETKTTDHPAPDAASAKINNPLAGSEYFADGVYCRGPEGWTKLQQTMVAGGGSKHMGRVFVPGLMPQMVLYFRGATAPVEMSDRRPTFLIKQAPQLDTVPGHSARDWVIVRLDKKKDHRELQTTSGATMFNYKAAFTKGSMPEIDAQQAAPGQITVVPHSDLKPGEYLLTWGMGSMGYDFGIVEKK